MMYAPSEPELRHDYPIAYRDQHVLTEGRIDRLVLLKQNGKIVAADILDFKTDRFAPDDGNSLNKLCRYYEPQLLAYRRAIQEAYGLSQRDITASLLFLETGQEWRG